MADIQQRADGLLETRFCAFDTSVRIGAYGEHGLTASLIQAQRACETYENLFSRTLATSDIAHVNTAKGAWTSVDPRTLQVLEAALGYCAASEGAFDITIGAASRLWDLKRAVIPDPEALAKAVRHVNWRMVELDASGCRVRLHDPEAMIDLGGIAKGWIADELGALLASAGATGYVIDLGGNILVGGQKPNGQPWKIALRDPADPTKAARLITLERGSAVTSGTYERACAVEGVPYHHILDPRTGMPAKVEHQSATVVCERSLDAEGFSTTLLVLGPKRARHLKAAHPEILQVYYL